MSAFLSAPRILFEEKNAADVRCFLRGNKTVELSMGKQKKNKKKPLMQRKQEKQKGPTMKQQFVLIWIWAQRSQGIKEDDNYFESKKDC